MALFDQYWRVFVLKENEPNPNRNPKRFFLWSVILFFFLVKVPFCSENLTKTICHKNYVLLELFTSKEPIVKTYLFTGLLVYCYWRMKPAWLSSNKYNILKEAKRIFHGHNFVLFLLFIHHKVDTVPFFHPSPLRVLLSGKIGFTFWNPEFSDNFSIYWTLVWKWISCLDLQIHVVDGL